MLGCSHYGELKNENIKSGIDYYLSKFYIEIKGSKCKQFLFISKYIDNRIIVDFIAVPSSPPYFIFIFKILLSRIHV